VSESVDHRQLGVDLFNRTWTLMEAENRTPEQDDEMIQTAHASAYHWLQAGTTKNFARSQWQLSRVYVTLGRGEPALFHARRCLAYCEAANDIEDWDLPYAYEALARAHLAVGDADEAKRCADQARELGARVADDDDREHLELDLATLP
jgi:tetratricopeptide (TPR) repeat protein